MRYIKLGKEKYSVKWLRSVTEEKAVRSLPHLDRNQVVNAWKQANGLTKRNSAKVIEPKVDVLVKSKAKK